MLQKLIMVFLSLVSMVASAIVPTGWFAPDETAPEEVRVVDERLSTLGSSPGHDFARVSVLWVEIDGRRLTEDAWGEGRIDSLRFKVGIKPADGSSLRLGSRTIQLSPTDVFTVRDFVGRFSVSDVGTASATLALDGRVKNTIVQGGEGGGLVTVGRRGNQADGGVGQTNERLAYVVLDTGPVGTLEVAPGTAFKLFTAGPTGATDVAGIGGATALDVRWVRIDGSVVQRYTHGEGELRRVEFEPDARMTSRLHFNGRELGFREGERVEVRDFLGAWTVTMRPGGGARLKLDGWAGHADVGTSQSSPLADGGLSFSWQPSTPSTRDRVVFQAEAETPSEVLLYEWTFVRKLPELEYTPEDATRIVDTGKVVERRFTRPGTWEITLRAVGTGGSVTEVTQDLLVANTAPVAAFDWFPNAPVSLEQVRFYDRSGDLDGSVLARRWDFGDGTTSTDREPVKSYARNGHYNVTLTITDDQGAESSVRKLIVVRNAPPECSFELDPPDPPAFQIVSLIDRSRDREGALVNWSWTVSNLENTTMPTKDHWGSTAYHTFLAADLHRVRLRVTDVEGDASECSIELRVRNSPPLASFTVFPDVPVTRQFTYLNSTSTDPDGRIVKTEWRIEGDPEVKRGARIGYSFPRAAVYPVTITVTDNGGLTSSMTREISVGNSGPIASFVFAPVNPLTSQAVTFTNTSYDPDGDAQVSWEWDFGPGQDPRFRTGPVVTHSFPTLGTYNVSMKVTDEKGNANTVIRSISVLNRPPVGNITYAPNPASVLDNITFTTDARDPDGTIERYEWFFGDGGRAEGPDAIHRFAEAGRFQVKLVLVDNHGGVTEIPLTIDVRSAGPLADFLADPVVGAVGRATTFHDRSEGRGAPITTWAWQFGDGTTSGLASPTKTFVDPGQFSVRLTVTDESGNQDTRTKAYDVTYPPVASFTASTLTPAAGQGVTFTDTSQDPDGFIAERRWRIDGAEVSTAAQFTHAFDVRGRYMVQLTVWDDMGVSSHRFENITVQNVGPVADFSIPNPIVDGVLATFESTSIDPDGTIDASRTQWRVNNLAMAPGPDRNRLEHVFRSGLHTVTVIVFDDSGARAEKTSQVVVYASHEVRYHIMVRYADGSIPTLQGFNVAFLNTRTGEAHVQGTGVVMDAPTATATLVLPYGTWVHGDTYRVSGTSLVGPIDMSFGTRATDQSVLLRIIIYPRNLSPPTLVLENGVQPGTYGDLPRIIGLGPSSGAYYPSPGEKFRGSVQAAWFQPPGPVDGGLVQVWVNRSVTHGLRLPAAPAELNLPPITAKTSGFTDPTGRFVFEVPYLGRGLGLDQNPPGWYSVDVTVTWPAQLAYIPPGRATGYVYVDLEGAIVALVERALP